MRRALTSLNELNKTLRLPTAFALRNAPTQSIRTENVCLSKLQLPTSSLAITRYMHVSGCSHSKETVVDEVIGEEDPNASNSTEPPRDPAKDRTMVIPVEVSMRYLESNAYKETYGDSPVWVLYRRNFKGQFAPRKTRRTCIRGGLIATGNPCPICRDEYLVLDYRNVKLLQQFISPFNGEVLPWHKTGICRVRHLDLLVAMERARDYGTITFDVPIRHYNYSDYYRATL